MTHLLRKALAISAVIALPAAAQQPVDGLCSSTATQATGYTPGTDTGPDGSRVRGAARGAAVGATVGAVQNNQHDYAPQGLKDEHRHDQAKTGAAVGVVAGGSRSRQNRRQDQKKEDAWQQTYNACMQQKSTVAAAPVPAEPQPASAAPMPPPP